MTAPRRRREEPSGRHHDRDTFDCRVHELNEYFERCIDAKDAAAAEWYHRFGAVPLLDDPLELILPLSVIAAAIAAPTSLR